MKMNNIENTKEPSPGVIPFVIFVVMSSGLIGGIWYAASPREIELKSKGGSEIPTQGTPRDDSDTKVGSEPFTCTSKSGATMSFEEAFEIASESDCVAEGELQSAGSCNVDTGTWWINLKIDRPNCYPACVVDIETGQVEINWRCTGLIVE